MQATYRDRLITPWTAQWQSSGWWLHSAIAVSNLRIHLGLEKNRPLLFFTMFDHMTPNNGNLSYPWNCNGWPPNNVRISGLIARLSMDSIRSLGMPDLPRSCLVGVPSLPGHAECAEPSLKIPANLTSLRGKGWIWTSSLSVLFSFDTWWYWRSEKWYLIYRIDPTCCNIVCKKNSRLQLQPRLVEVKWIQNEIQLNFGTHASFPD